MWSGGRHGCCNRHTQLQEIRWYKSVDHLIQYRRSLNVGPNPLSCSEPMKFVADQWSHVTLTVFFEDHLSRAVETRRVIGQRRDSVWSSRRQAISVTVKSATNQFGDTSQSTRRQLISCLSLYIFRVIRYRHIHFGTSVVQRYHKFCDPIHSSPYVVPPHTCPTVRRNPPNTVSVS